MQMFYCWLCCHSAQCRLNVKPETWLIKVKNSFWFCLYYKDCNYLLSAFVKTMIEFSMNWYKTVKCGRDFQEPRRLLYRFVSTRNPKTWISWISEKNTFKKLNSALIWSFFMCYFKVKFLHLPKWNGIQVGRKWKWKYELEKYLWNIIDSEVWKQLKSNKKNQRNQTQKTIRIHKRSSWTHPTHLI